MPTDVSYPLNMQVSNLVLSRTGAKWKDYQFKHQPDFNNEQPPNGGSFVYPKRYNMAGMARPFFNKQGGSSYEAGAKSIEPVNGLPETLAYTGTGSPYANYHGLGVGDGNAFRARPIKHWRLQYGNTNSKQSYRNRYQLGQLSKPGGVIVGSRNRLEINAGEFLENQLKEHGRFYCTICPQVRPSDANTIADCCDPSYSVNEDCGELSSTSSSTAGLKMNALIGVSEEEEEEEEKQKPCINTCMTVYGVVPNEVGKLTKVGRYNPVYFRYNVPPYNCFAHNLDDRDNANGIWTGNYHPSRIQSCNNCPLYQCRANPEQITSGGSQINITETQDQLNETPQELPQFDCGTIKKCINICDPPTKARRRVRTSSRINRPDLCERPYYISFKNYMKARCKTYKQNSFQFKTRDEGSGDGISSSESVAPCTCGNGVVTGLDEPNTDCNRCCGLSAYKSQVFRSNCPAVASIKTCQGVSPIGAYSSSCSKVYYKPNNCQYAQQGAVSAGSRLLRLKMQTINKNAFSIGNAYGSNASSALAYSSRPQAPFINKQKMNAGGYSKKCQNTTFKYPCDTSLYHLYRPGGGNPTTSGMNDENNNRIIGHFCTTSIWPGQGNGMRKSLDDGFIFMERQDKQVRLTGIGSRYGGDSGTGGVQVTF